MMHGARLEGDDHHQPVPDAGRDFIRDIVAADLAAGRHTAGGDAVSAGAERLSAFRPRQVDLPEFRHRRRSTAAAAICVSTTPIRPRKSRNTSTRSSATCAGSASTGGRTCIYASDYFEQLYDWAEYLIERGQAYVDDQSADEMRAVRAARLTEPGSNSPYRDRSRRREPRPVPRACARANSRTARACCARRSTWRRRTSTCAIRCSTASARRITTAPATSGASIRCYDFAHGQSDAHRRHHAFDLHAGIRGPSAALRLAARASAACPSRPRQIEFARLNLTYTVLSQAQADSSSCEEGHVSRLGRSAHADARRAAPARRAARGDSRVRASASASRKANSTVDVGDARISRARRSEPERAAPHGRAAAAQARDRELSGRSQPRNSMPSTIPKIRRRARGEIPFGARAVHRARRLHGEPAEEILPPGARAAKCGCAMHISSPAARS